MCLAILLCVLVLVHFARSKTFTLHNGQQDSLVQFFEMQSTYYLRYHEHSLPTKHTVLMSLAAIVVQCAYGKWNLNKDYCTRLRREVINFREGQIRNTKKALGMTQDPKVKFSRPRDIRCVVAKLKMHHQPMMEALYEKPTLDQWHNAHRILVRHHQSLQWPTVFQQVALL